MKNVLAIGVCFCSFLGIAAAQTGTLMTVKLPNAAMVGSTTLPAGDYTVRELEASGNSAVIEFTNSKGNTATVLASEVEADRKSPDRTEVILKSDGERLQVDQIWLADRDYGFQIAK
jgi:hypothetical protein